MLLGCALASEGHMGREIYLIARGEVLVSRSLKRLCVASTGGCVGLLAMLGMGLGSNGYHRTFTATAATRADLCSVDHVRLLELMALAPELEPQLRRVALTQTNGGFEQSSNMDGGATPRALARQGDAAATDAQTHQQTHDMVVPAVQLEAMLTHVRRAVREEMTAAKEDMIAGLELQAGSTGRPNQTPDHAAT